MEVLRVLWPTVVAAERGLAPPGNGVAGPSCDVIVSCCGPPINRYRDVGVETVERLLVGVPAKATYSNHCRVLREVANDGLADVNKSVSHAQSCLQSKQNNYKQLPHV